MDMFQALHLPNTEAFFEGWKAKSILDNPYWKNYPNASDEQLKARLWVDGWYQAYIFKGVNKNAD